MGAREVPGGGLSRLFGIVLFAVLAVATWLAPSVARAGPGRVSVHPEAGLEPQARRLEETAALTFARIEEDLRGLPQAGDVEVRLVKRAEEMSRLAPPGRGAPTWAAGVAYPDLGVVIVAARTREGDLIDIDKTYTHELAHMALSRALGDRHVPRWLTEGFAYLHSSDFSLARAQTLSSAVIGRKVIPIPELDDGFPPREDENALAYAESYDFVAWLAHRGRFPDDRDDGDREALRELFAELAAGRTMDEATRAAFGLTLRQLDEEWRASLVDRYLWLPVGVGTTIFWIIAALLLALGWTRRRLQARAKLSRWELEEAASEAAAAARRGELMN